MTRDDLYEAFHFIYRHSDGGGDAEHKAFDLMLVLDTWPEGEIIVVPAGAPVPEQPAPAALPDYSLSYARDKHSGRVTISVNAKTSHFDFNRQRIASELAHAMRLLEHPEGVRADIVIEQAD